MENKPDWEYPHIVAKNGKIYCEYCGAWDYLKHWIRFIDEHKHCLEIAVRTNTIK